ncbi:MAG: DM13 domain-containing protein [Cyanobacteria bacterium P01_A01_bin.45]
MRLKHLVIVGFAILSVGCNEQISEQQNNPSPDNNTVATSVSGNVIQSGSFQKAEYSIQGSVKVISDNGKNYLEFDQNFQTDSGPDLLVILHRDASLPNKGIQEQDYVNIAPLKSTNGTQRYEVPTNVDLTNFKSVAVWCRKFNTTFGFAPLQG